jgi:hypothetical protein
MSNTATVLENYKDIQDEVLQFGFNDGPQVNRNRVKRWVNEAQRQIARQVDSPEFLQIEPITLEAEVFKYPLPARLLRILVVWYQEQAIRLRPLEASQFTMNSPKITQGPPTLYYLHKGELWTFPKPVSSVVGENLEVFYFREPARLVGDTDEPELNSNYWHLLVDYAARRAFEAEDDYEAAQYFEGRFKAELDSYASDVQWREQDKPRVLSGSWAGAGYGSRLMF